MVTNHPPKILHVSTIAVTLARFLAPIASRLREQGWQVDAAAAGISQDEECALGFDQCLEIPFERKFLSSANLTVAKRAIKKIVDENDYDLVHVHTPIASFVTRNALRKRPPQRKVVYTAHGFHFFDGAPWLRNKLFSTLEKLASPWMDHLVVINQQDYKNALKLKIANKTNMTYMSGIGVDLNEFQNPDNQDAIRADKLAQFGIPNNSYVFLQIAGYTPNKRHCDAVRAFAKLPKDRRFDLLFAGDGTMMEATRELAAELGVADRIHFLGYRTDIIELLVTCDAMMLISQREGLPRSVMEAMAMGKKIIGSNIRGTSDLIRDGVGLLVPPCDPQALSESMLKSVNFIPDQAQAQRVLQACSLPTIIEQHVQLYSKLLNRPLSHPTQPLTNVEAVTQG